MIHICFLSICYKLQHPTQGIKQSTFFCLYAANVWVSFFFFFFQIIIAKSDVLMWLSADISMTQSNLLGCQA